MTNEPIKSENTDVSPNPPAPQPKPGTCSEPWGNRDDRPIDYQRGVVPSDSIIIKSL